MNIKEQTLRLKQNKKINDIFQNFIKQISLVAISLIIVVIFLVILGYSPVAMLTGLSRALTKDIAGSIRIIIPMLLAGLAICVPFKAQVFNLGVDGQIYMGAIASTAIMLSLPPQLGPIGLIIGIITAMMAGALYGLLAAALNIYFGANLMVITLFLNFIASLFTTYMTSDLLRDREAQIQMNASALLPESMWLARLSFFEPSSANTGIYLALIAAVVIAFIFFKTTLGYEIKIVGTNSNFAQYGGIKSNLVIMKVMAISGALAGLIGVVEVAAVHHKLVDGFNPDFGFDGVVVSLLAGNNPIGIIFSAIFLGVLKNGGMNMERVTDVPADVTVVAMAIIIMTVSSNFVIKKIKRRAK